MEIAKIYRFYRFSTGFRGFSGSATAEDALGLLEEELSRETKAGFELSREGFWKEFGVFFELMDIFVIFCNYDQCLQPSCQLTKISCYILAFLAISGHYWSCPSSGLGPELS